MRAKATTDSHALWPEAHPAKSNRSATGTKRKRIRSLRENSWNSSCERKDSTMQRSTRKSVNGTVEERLSHALVKGIDTYIEIDAEEARLFRFTLKHSIFLAGIVGLIVLVYAYVLPGWGV